MHEHRQRAAVDLPQIGSNSGSVRLRPAMLASTMTPTAPLVQVRASSSIAALRVLPGQRREPADAIRVRRLRLAIVSFDSRAAGS